MDTAVDNAKIERYPAYKDSGVEWIGEIPENWKSERLASILNNVSERNRTDLPLLSITREKGVILRDMDNEEENHNYIPDDLSNYRVLRKGNFGMNKMKAWQGSYGISEQDGIVSPAYFIFELRDDIDSGYFHLAIRSRLYISFFCAASDGVRIGQWDLSKDRMKKIPFLIPPKKEQTAIASFLDRKTALIDQAIGIKQKQIELLKERRQILIHKAVTRGLNPNAKMKDSGVEWIGEVPEGWVNGKLGHYETVNNGTTPSRVNPNYWNGNICWLSSSKVNDLIVNTASEYITERAVKDCSLRIFPKSTIIMGIVGQGKTRGTSSILNIESTINQNMVGIIPNNYLDPKYLHNFLIQGYSFIRRGNGSNQEAMNSEIVKRINVLVPPKEEQIPIVEYIESVTTKISTAISLKEQEIEKLKEYKATLINSAVTGKIKVS